MVRREFPKGRKEREMTMEEYGLRPCKDFPPMPECKPPKPEGLKLTGEIKMSKLESFIKLCQKDMVHLQNLSNQLPLG